MKSMMVSKYSGKEFKTMIKKIFSFTTKTSRGNRKVFKWAKLMP